MVGAASPHVFSLECSLVICFHIKHKILRVGASEFVLLLCYCCCCVLFSWHRHGLDLLFQLGKKIKPLERPKLLFQIGIKHPDVSVTSSQVDVFKSSPLNSLLGRDFFLWSESSRTSFDSNGGVVMRNPTLSLYLVTLTL